MWKCRFCQSGADEAAFVLKAGVPFIVAGSG